MKYYNSEPMSTNVGESADGLDNNGFQPDTDTHDPLGKAKECVSPSGQVDEKTPKEKSSHHKENVEGDLDIYCGVGSCKPNFMQGCKNMACFSAVFSFSGLVTSALNSYITSQITTLEKHFNFNSSVSGVLMSCNDLGYLATTLFMSYYTRRVHIPRAMAVSTIVYGLSGLLCAVSFFGTRDQLSSPPKESADEPQVFFTQTCQNFSILTNITCGDTSTEIRSPFGISEHWKKIAVAILAVGMILQGVAKSPRQPFIITYIDDNVPKNKTTLYLGIIIGLSFFGPALAFGLGALFSNMYITLEETSISPRDPRWLGAWWMGFLIFGGAGLIVGLPLIFFPKRMRRKTQQNTIKQKKIVDKKTMHKFWHDFKGFLKAVLHLACNPVYVCLTLASSINLMGVSGWMAFFTKYLETQFSITASKASLILGILNVLIACLGTAIGGWLTSRLNLSPMSCLKLIVGAGIIITGIFSLGFVLGCDQPVVHMGLDMDSAVNQTISQCVQDCHCDDTNYFPICGNDGRNYFSPCHAGCLSMNSMTFTNCTCLSTNETQIATGGLCESDCSYLIPYLTMICVGGFISTMTMMPGFIVNIRCVKEEDKPFAVGFSAFAGTLIGFFPGPVIFGALVDSTCIVWKVTCGSVGACSRYDIEMFRYRFHALLIGLRLITMCFFILALIFAVCSKAPVFQPHTEEITVTVPAKGQENVLSTKKSEAESKTHYNTESVETYI